MRFCRATPTQLRFFSGGLCRNCGVAINGVTNTAVIAMGVAGSPSGDGIQFLNLANNTFAPPIPSVNRVSEDILWDPGRNLILSPGEFGVYDLFRTSSPSTPEFANLIFGQLDSAAEDCTTGIALSSLEATNQVFIADFDPSNVYTGFASGHVDCAGTLRLVPGILRFPNFRNLGRARGPSCRRSRG